MRKGVTLIEILVVIAVVLVLTSIIAPVYSSSRSSAKASAMIQQQRQLTVALQLYSDDHEGKVILNGSMPGEDWPTRLHPYVKSSKTFKNPNYQGKPDIQTVLGDGFALNSCVLESTMIETPNPVWLFESVPFYRNGNWFRMLESRFFDAHAAIIYPGSVPSGGRWLSSSRRGGSIVSYIEGNTKWVNFQSISFRGTVCSVSENEEAILETKFKENDEKQQ